MLSTYNRAIIAITQSSVVATLSGTAHHDHNADAVLLKSRGF